VKVVLNVTMSGSRNGEDWPAKGSVIDLPEAEAVDYLNAGICRKADESAVEIATADAPEAATSKRTKKS
jgi:hypothetical protein